MEQAEVAREPAAGGDVGLGAGLEDIEGAGEDEGELERRAQRLVAGLRGEYRDVQWVFLWVVVIGSARGYSRGWREGVVEDGMYVFAYYA